MSVSIDVKKIFLSFVQQYFIDHPRLTWNVDPRITKIFIADKYAVDPAVVEKMPAIILNLGTRGFARTSIGQVLERELSRTHTLRSDLIQGMVTFHCISKNGIEAETIADGLLLRIMAFKDEFRKHKIHQILGTNIGEEQVIRSDSSPRMSMVPVYVQYTVQAGTSFEEDIYDLVVSNNNAQVYEAIGYEVSGQHHIVFNTAPAVGSILTATYTGKYTLQTKTETLIGAVTGTNRIFEVSEDIYTEFPITSGFTQSITI
jgi:hypothetical protein